MGLEASDSDSLFQKTYHGAQRGTRALSAGSLCRRKYLFNTLGISELTSSQMFGFKHTMKNLDHNDHKVQRSRLYGRLLQVNGPIQLAQLYPNIESRLESVLLAQLKQGRQTSDGWTSVPLASTVRTVASQMMGVIFFGDIVCE
jgi:hypothetical protein